MGRDVRGIIDGLIVLGLDEVGRLDGLLVVGILVGLIVVGECVRDGEKVVGYTDGRDEDDGEPTRPKIAYTTPLSFLPFILAPSAPIK